MPATAVGSANGKSMSESTMRRPGKVVAHQHPGDEEAEHAIDACRRERSAERQAIRRDDPRIAHRVPEERGQPR